jgi:hypothetical protein
MPTPIDVFGDKTISYGHFEGSEMMRAKIGEYLMGELK